MEWMTGPVARWFVGWLSELVFADADWSLRMSADLAPGLPSKPTREPRPPGEIAPYI